MKFKTLMLRSSLYDYDDTYILVKGTISVTNSTDAEVIFWNFAPFTDSISEINNTQIDNAKDIDVVMPIYNLIEYSDNYWKTSETLWQYYRNETALTNFSLFSFSFNFKDKLTGKTRANNTKDVKIKKVIEISK